MNSRTSIRSTQRSHVSALLPVHHAVARAARVLHRGLLAAIETRHLTPVMAWTKRVVLGLALIIIFGGTGVLVATERLPGDQKVCATFCPTDPSSYCSFLGHEASGTCSHEACSMAPFIWPATITCDTGPVLR